LIDSLVAQLAELKVEIHEMHRCHTLVSKHLPSVDTPVKKKKKHRREEYKHLEGVNI